MKEQELKHIKRLGKRVLDQRTETEQFFLSALTQVKEEIQANRAQYRRDAEAAYHSRMLQAQQGKAPFPKTRTFRRLPHSTNSVYSDLEEAERFENVDGSMDISDLTWEQKEKVLRILFAEMNGLVKRKGEEEEEAGPSLPPIPQEGSVVQVEQTDEHLLSKQRLEEKLIAIEG